MKSKLTEHFKRSEVQVDHGGSNTWHKMDEV